MGFPNNTFLFDILHVCSALLLILLLISGYSSMLEVGQLVSEWLSVEDILPGIERGDLLEFRRTVRVGKAKRRMYTVSFNY